MKFRNGDDRQDGHPGVGHGEQAGADAVSELRGVLENGPGGHEVGVPCDEGGEGAGRAGLQVHDPLTVEAGVGAAVGGQAGEEVEQLQVGGEAELNLLEVQKLDDGGQVAVVLRPPLTMGQDEGPVDPRVLLALLLPRGKLVRLREPAGINLSTVQ